MTTLYRRAIDKRLLSIGAAALTAVAAFGEVIYENDFATRTSTGVVPMTEWRTYDYVTGYIANTNGAAPFTSTANVMQDGWIKERENTNGNVYCENAMVWAGVSGKDNPAAVLGRKSTSNSSSCVIKQRLGNTFTNGTLTAQFDFMPPGQWVSYGTSSTLRRVNIAFGDERFYSPAVSQNNKIYRYTAGGVGVALHGPEGGRKRKVWYNADMDFANTNMTETVVTQGAWLRVSMTINIDARTWGFSMYEMGTSQPALDDATPASAVYSASDLPFSDDSVTSISSIALVGVGVCWGYSEYSDTRAPTHVAWFDNIRISHNGELCYENDFATRRWRLFGGTSSHTYVADCLVTNSVGNEVYVLEEYLVPNRVDNGTTVQPIGIDGWRRTHHENGTANAYVKSDSSGTYLRFNCNSTETTSQAYLAQPFGSTISSGKLRLAVDARLPTAWDANGVLWVTLAGDQYYNADPKTARSKYRWACVGIRGADNTPTYIYDSNGNARNPTPDAAITAGNWYRLVVTADLDAQTTDFSVFEQGTSYPNSETADGTCIFTTNGIAKIGTASPLTCFSLGAVKRLVYFDNVKIWHIPTGSDTETLLYENYFTTRTIYAQDTRIAPLVGTLRLNPEGQDNWTRVYSSESATFVDWADSNPALTFARNGSETWAVQDIGQTVKKGLLVAQADIRPPKGWIESGASTYVRLGGDALRQSPLRRDENYFLNNIAMGFGFKNTNSGKRGNIYTNSTIAAFQGDLNAGGAMTNAEVDVDTTHWYRFVATTAVSKNHYDVSVYDMGTEHPTLATPTPAEPVATFTELPFRRTKDVLGGISCISVSGHRAPQSLYDPSLEPLIDNLRVSHTLFGSKIIIR